MEEKRNKELEEYYSGLSKKDLKEIMSELNGQLGECRVRNMMDHAELRKTLAAEKKAQLDKIRTLYSEIKIASGIELAVAELARVQGMESVALADLTSMENYARNVEVIENSIDIARKIMKQKEQQGGRSR